MTSTVLRKFHTQPLLALFTAGILFTLFYFPSHLNAQNGRMETLIREFDQDEAVLNRKYDVRYSDQYFDRFEQFYSDWSDKLEEIPFGTLSSSEKTDYLLLKNHLERQHYFMNREKERFESVAQWVPGIEEFMEFIQQRRIGTAQQGAATAEWMNSWAEQITQLHNHLAESEPLLRSETIAITDILQNIQWILEDANRFYSGYDIDYTWWTAKPYESLDQALTEYAEFVSGHFDAENEQLDESGIVGNPIGEEEIQKRLAFEMINYTPQELISIAEHQFAKAEQEMLKAARELGYGDDWNAALEHVKNNYVAPGEKPELIMKLHRESMDFIQERELVTIPDLLDEVWRMQMMSPERQLINPFFLGGEVITISYPTNTMDHDAKLMSMRGNNPHFNRATVQHELIPGHHMQGYFTRRYNTHRSPFQTPFWGEGWALYWEILLWDLGFAETPEDRIGMLFWRTHRYARIIFSLNYHLGNWTPQQCIDYLVDRVGHEYANAEAEVRRSFEGRYGPLYQIAYMIGGMQIYALYNELVESKKMSPAEFHDTILRNGSIPIRAVKGILTQESLSEEGYQPWNFAEYIYH